MYIKAYTLILYGGVDAYFDIGEPCRRKWDDYGKAPHKTATRFIEGNPFTWCAIRPLKLAPTTLKFEEKMAHSFKKVL